MIHNIAVVAHVDSGKTTTTEQILYLSGLIKNLGSVDKASSYMDWSDIERQRGITIFSEQARLQWKGEIINLIDTPGHIDFSPELERSLKILDGAVLIISAVEGVQDHTETIWKMLRKYGIPTLIFVNKLDRVGVNFNKLYNDIERNLTKSVLFLHHADKAEKKFDGFIDLLEDKEYRWDINDTGKLVIKNNKNKQNKIQLIEKIADKDDNILCKYIESQNITNEELKKSIKTLTVKCKIFPVLFGCSIRGIGISNLLDAIVKFLPSACRNQNNDFSAFVYKIRFDESVGKLTFIRVLDGNIKVRDSIFTGIDEEKVTAIRQYNGQKFIEIEELKVGDIGALCGIKNTKVGKVLGKTLKNIKSKSLIVPVLNCKVEPVNEEELPSVLKALRILNEENPSLGLRWDSDKKEMNINVMGQIHIEVLKESIVKKFGVNVKFNKPSVNYIETVTDISKGFCHFEPKKHYAEVEIEIEPNMLGKGVTYESCLSVDVLPSQYQNIIEKTVAEAVKHGVLIGSAVSDIKIKLIDGKYHLKHTHGGDFRIAFIRAVQQALKNNKCVILEPLYKYKIIVDKDFVGRVMSDILRMKGSFNEPEIINNKAVLKGEVPISTSMNYQVELASMTSGKALISMIFSRYERCHNQQQVIQSVDYKVSKDNSLYNSISLFREKKKMKKIK